MKRIYACILIVAALLGVSLYSSGRVQGFAQDISADLDCALEAVRQKDFSTARQALAEGAELCDTMRETMSHLLRTADYTELEAALRAADGYLEQQATEDALGELATIPFVLDGQVLEDNLRWCGKDRAWLERTATANTVLPQEILLLIGNETEDYFLLKKEGRQPGGKR